MMDVLIDARISGADGIGRYTRNLVKFLSLYNDGQIDSQKLTISLLARDYSLQAYADHYYMDESRHYTTAEVDNIAFLPQNRVPHVFHCTDYRTPLYKTKCPIVVSIHDIFRHTQAELCYKDEEFVVKYGQERFEEINRIIDQLSFNLQDNDIFKPSCRVEHLAALFPDRRHWVYYTLMLAWSLTQAAAIVAPTAVVQQHIQTSFSVKTPINVIPYGIDHIQADVSRQPDQAVQGLSADETFLLYVGQARKHKNLETLFHAFQQIVRTHPQIQLWLVGKDFQQTDVWGTDVRRLNLQGRVKFLGYVDDQTLGTLYQEAVALIHLSKQEGFGFTPLEALATGTPVIVADIPVMREVLKEQAIYVDPFDVASVVEAIASVIAPKNRPQNAQKAIAYASQYQWRTVIEQYVDIYNQLARTAEENDQPSF